MKLQTVQLDRISPNPNQPRKAFDAGALQDLADSIREHGLLQPITVRPAGKGVEIIAGERRFRACQLVGLESAPCIVVADVNDEKSFILATLENCARKDMKPIEEAQAYATIVAMGKSVDEVAKLVGKATFAIAWRLELLNLAPEFQTVELPMNVGRLMSRCSVEGQRAIMRRYMGGDFKTTQECEKFCNAVIAREAQVDLFAPAAVDAFGADDLRRERAAANRSKFQAAWSKSMQQLQPMVDAIEGVGDVELADALDADIDRMLVEAREVEAQYRRLRIRLENAKAARMAVVA